ncbi:MAG: hypothetical protein AMXMBFR7_21230 [Planctomycetota bacterium]
MSPFRLAALAALVLSYSILAGEAEAPPAPEPPQPAPAEAPEAKPNESANSKTDQEIVVTATRLPTPREQTGVSITSFSAKRMEESNDDQAAETVRMAPGVSIAQSGRRGDFTELRIRGGETNHNLILWDGFRVNQVGGLYGWDSLDPVGADRIEIAAGPGSALFGSDAMTGTVQVLTAKGEGDPKASVSGAAGTYGTDRETLSVEGQHAWFSYNVASSRIHRLEASVNNSELESINYAGRFDFQLAKQHTLKLIGRGNTFSKGGYEVTPLTNGTALSPPDPDDQFRKNENLYGVEYAGHPLPIWEVIARSGYYELESVNRTSPQQDFGGDRFFARNYRTSWEIQNNVTAFESEHIRNVVTAGYYGEYEGFKTTFFGFGSFSRDHYGRVVQAFYLQDRLELFDRAFLTAGVRREENEDFGDFLTARADASILIPESDSRIFGSVGNSFRAPDFFELFSAFGGNPSLQPEENFAWDAGLEQHFWKRRIVLRGTYFRNEFDSLIGPGPSAQSQNVAGALTQGWEFFFGFNPLKQMSLEASATFLRSRDDNGTRLLRRPPRTYTGRLVARPLIDLVPDQHDGLEIAFELLSVSSRSDSFFQPGFVRVNTHNDGYLRADLSINYRFWHDRFRAFARFQNVFDEKYQDVLTFPADGANIMSGLEFTWQF